MIPVYLITGFLGSGKTTLLREIYRRNAHRRLVYLVNEFSLHDVDAAILGTETEGVISVAGGSIFCTCLVTEFVSRLRSILEKQDQGGSVFEGLIIEASGTANPSVIRALLRDTKLDSAFRIRKIIAVVDPFTLPKLLHTLPNIRQQIAAADLVILNKTDLASDTESASLRESLRTLNGTAEIYSTRYCSLPFNPVVETGEHSGPLSVEPAHPPQKNYERFSLQSRKPLNLDLLKKLIHESEGDIYRVKGFYVDESADLMYLDYSLSSGLITLKTDIGTHPHLEFIFNGNRGERIRTGIKALLKNH